jgi:hypothetical protein
VRRPWGALRHECHAVERGNAMYIGVSLVGLILLLVLLALVL